MSRIIDLRNDSRIMRAVATRNASSITRIALHHSATANGDVFAFQNHWRSTLGWDRGGYHEVIILNGDTQLIYNPEVVTWGVGNHNHNTYHICVVGNGRFTQEQERALEQRLSVNRERFKLPVSAIMGHNEFSGHSSNSCPGRNMSQLRARLNNGNQSTTPTPQTPNNTNTHTVARGETLTGIARQYNTTVANLQRINNITNPNILRIGQVLRLHADEIHTVARGETLSSIARRYNVTVQNIVSWNNIGNPNVISVGQRLTIRR